MAVHDRLPTFRMSGHQVPDIVNSCSKKESCKQPPAYPLNSGGARGGTSTAHVKLGIKTKHKKYETVLVAPRGSSCMLCRKLYILKFETRLISREILLMELGKKAETLRLQKRRKYHNPCNPCNFHFLFHYPNMTPYMPYIIPI